MPRGCHRARSHQPSPFPRPQPPHASSPSFRSDHRHCRGGQTTGSKLSWLRDATAAGPAARGQCDLGTPADLQAVDALHKPADKILMPPAVAVKTEDAKDPSPTCLQQLSVNHY